MKTQPRVSAAGRAIGWGAASAVLLSFLPAASRAQGEAAAASAPAVAVDGSNGYPNQAPVAGWLQEIEARQAKVRTLVASYEIQDQPRDRANPNVEMGTVKFRFGAPNRPVLERWEGTSEAGKVVRIVRDGLIYEKVNDRLVKTEVGAKPRLTPSLVRFPLLPEACAARFYVWFSSEFEAGTSGPVPGRNFPTALGLEPRRGMDVSPRMKRYYLALDEATGLAYKIRLHEVTAAHTIVELFDLKPNAEVSDADFAAPADPASGAPKKDAPGAK